MSPGITPTNLPLRLAVGACALLVLGACGDSGTDPASNTTPIQTTTPSTALTTAPTTPTSTPAPEKPRLIAYAGGESPGVEVSSMADAKKLRGAPAAFKQFIGAIAQHLADTTTCTTAAVGVTVETVRTDGYAAGGVNECGGYATLWAVVDGKWKQIQGTQDTWDCRVLKRYTVPSDVAGTGCYNYKTQKSHDYHRS